MGMCMSLEGGEKIRLDKEMLKAEAKAALLLAEMPGRLCSNAAIRNCSLHTQQGCKGINQDCMLVWEEFSAEEESVFLGVFDGHGPNGQMVASKVRDCLPSLLTLPLESLLEGCDTPHHHVYKSIKFTDEQICPKIHNDTPSTKLSGRMPGFVEDNENSDNDIEERFVAAFHKMDERLKLHPKISCMSSGTTAVAILVQGKDLVAGSVGDSRAILVTRCPQGSLVADRLTVELKPDSPGEKERILNCNGRVFALDEEPHIQRLWLPHTNSPGLAMARALGDFCLKEYGLIATPQISHRKLSEEDEVIVLATDGVWDVLSDTEVIEVICSSASKEEAAKAIVEAATNAWKRKNLTKRMDDCTVVCHFLKQEKPELSSPTMVSVDEVEAKDRSKTEDDAKLNQRSYPDQPLNNMPLPRYNTVVVSGLADELNALEELDQGEDGVSKSVKE